MSENVAMLIIMGVLIGLVVMEKVTFHLYMKAKKKEADDLLDRIMATDYTQFSQVRVAADKLRVPIEVVGVDELEKRMNDRIPEGVAI
jgi:hypothetical protein